MPEKEPGLFEFEYRDIGGVTAQCRTGSCNWHTTGQLTIEINDLSVVESPLIKACRQHHIDKDVRSLHNQFVLQKGNRGRGFASVSSDSCSGKLEL